MSARPRRDSVSTALGELVAAGVLTGMERLLLNTLADFSSADLESAIYPSQITLAERLGKCERMVRYLLERLEAAGLIRVYRSAPTRVAGGGWTRQTNRYLICWIRILNAARHRRWEVIAARLQAARDRRKAPGRTYRQPVAAYPLRDSESGSPRRPTRTGSHRSRGRPAETRRVPFWRDGTHPTCTTCEGAQSIYRHELGGYARCETCDGRGVIVR